MLCKFCQENVRGTPCQTTTQANRCPNNRDQDWGDDYITTIDAQEVKDEPAVE